MLKLTTIIIKHVHNMAICERGPSLLTDKNSLNNFDSCQTQETCTPNIKGLALAVSGKKMFSFVALYGKWA